MEPSFFVTSMKDHNVHSAGCFETKFPENLQKNVFKAEIGEFRQLRLQD